MKKCTLLIKNKLLAIGTLVIMSTMAFAPAAQAATLMKVGSRGSDVLTLQSELSHLGYSFGASDGIFGPKTLAAVEAFQKEDHLQVDGIVGPLTEKALEKTSGTAESSSGRAVAYSNADTELLARVVNAEARGESYSGQVAVAAVVLNRVADPAFPNTITGVVYQHGAFSSVSDGQINLTPSATAIKAAKEAESGMDPTKGAIYFFNPAKTTNKFLWSRPETIQIGNHRFTK